MDRSDSNHPHLKVCANRRPWTAFAFVAFCAIESVLSWRPLITDGTSDHSIVLALGLVLVIAILGQLLRIFRCRRERAVLGLAIASFSIGLVSAAVPNVIRPFTHLLARADLVLWVLAVALSLSMLLSSLSSNKLV
jgi:hypothetical protein